MEGFGSAERTPESNRPSRGLHDRTGVGRRQGRLDGSRLQLAVGGLPDQGYFLVWTRGSRIRTSNLLGGATKVLHQLVEVHFQRAALAFFPFDFVPKLVVRGNCLLEPRLELALACIDPVGAGLDARGELGELVLGLLRPTTGVPELLTKLVRLALSPAMPFGFVRQLRFRLDESLCERIDLRRYQSKLSGEIPLVHDPGRF